METEKGTSSMPQMMRNIFAVIMIIVYVAMGILMMCGVFPWLSGNFAWIRWGGGALLIVYGFWRAYRQFKGIDPDVTTRY